MQMAYSVDRWANGLDSPCRYDPPQFPPSADRLRPCRIDMSRAFEDIPPALPFLPTSAPAFPSIAMPATYLPTYLPTYLTLPYLTLPYLTLPYLTLPYLTLPYLTLPYLTLPYLTLPYLTLGYPRTVLIVGFCIPL